MTGALLPVAGTRETAALAWQLLLRHPVRLTLSALAFGGAGLCGLVAPWMLGRIVDTVRDDGATSEVTVAALVIVGSALLGGLLTMLAGSSLARAGEPALADLRERTLERVLGLDVARVEEAGAGDVLSRVGDDVSKVARSLDEVVPLVAASLVTLLLTVVGLFALDWRLGLAGVGAAPAYVAALRWFLPRSGPLYRAERVAQGERSEAMVNGLHGAATLRALSTEGRQLRLVEDASWRATRISLDAFGMLNRFGARNNRAELVGLLLVLVVGFLLVRDEATTVGQVTTAALYFHRLFNPVGALLMVFDELQSAGASLARLAGVVSMPMSARRAVAPPGAPRRALRTEDVGHRYRSDRTVLADVGCVVGPEETVALVGMTGAGKTTLAAVAAGMLTPSDGAVLLDDEVADADRLRVDVALVTQDVHVFAGTVRDNLLLARADAGSDELRAVLEATRAWPWVAALGDGLDTVVGHGAHPLTPAQAQQLALSRVLLRDPAVVVLDEATAEAGSTGARELEQAAASVTRGRGALVVAHRLSQAHAADRVVVLHEGRVVEQGSHDELLAHGGRYAGLWRAWSGD